MLKRMHRLVIDVTMQNDCTVRDAAYSFDDVIVLLYNKEIAKISRAKAFERVYLAEVRKRYRHVPRKKKRWQR